MNQYIFNEKIYRKNLNKKTYSFFPIVIVLIILLLGLALFLRVNKGNQNHYYFVKISSFSSYSSANELARKLQEKNAGGYIHFDEKYHVLASFYPTKNQAQNVVEKLKESYPNAEIYILSFDQFNGKNQLTKKQNDSIFDIIECIENMIENLNNILVQYEKNELSNTQFAIKITKQIDDFVDKKDSLFTSLNKPKFHNHRNILDKISTSLNSIKSNNQNQTQTLRYELMQILFNYSKFCSLF